MLRAHRHTQLERRLALGAVWVNSNNKVFCQSNGAALSPHAVRKRFRAIVAAQGLPRSDSTIFDTAWQA